MIGVNAGGYARCARAARATRAPLTCAGITRILCATGRSSLRYDGCAARHIMKHHRLESKSLYSHSKVGDEADMPGLLAKL